MENLIPIALGLLGQYSFLVKNVKLKPAIEKLSEWLGNLFPGSVEKEKLLRVEKNDFDEGIITELTNLMQKKIKGTDKVGELERLIKILEDKVADEKLTQKVNKEIVRITGDKNVFLKNVKGGDINITYN